MTPEPEPLDSIEYLWLRDFLGEHWETFLHFMEERDGEKAADSLYEKLGRLGED